MVLREAWRVYTAHWPKLVMAYLFAMLTGFVVCLIGFVVILPLMVVGHVDWELLGSLGPEALIQSSMLGTMIPQIGMAVVLFALLMVLVNPIVNGGMTHAIVQAVRNEPMGASEFWRAGIHYYGRFFGLMWIQMGLGLLAALVAVAVGGLLGWAGLAIWLLIVVLALFPVGTFGPYLIVAEDLGSGAATGKALKLLFGHPGEIILTLLVLIGLGLLAGLLGGVLNLIPTVGTILHLVLQFVAGPLFALYPVVRYLQRIEPRFHPPGGDAFYHPKPPPGP